MSVLSTGKKGTIQFYKGDDDGTPIGSHKVFDFGGAQQHVGMVQTWNQSQQMLMTSEDKPQSLIMMDTEMGKVQAELELRRQQRNWKMQIDSVTPMQKFEQYRSTQEVSLFGLGDNGKTVFHLHHDTRADEHVEEFVIKADSCRKYKNDKWTFSCHAQTRGGNLVLGRSDGAVSLYDAVMKSENATCVLDGMPGPVTSIDVTADGSMLCWTSPEFVFFSHPSREHWATGAWKGMGKPVVLQLAVKPEDKAKMLANEEEDVFDWLPVKFDAGTAAEELGKAEREIVTYSGSWQVRWSVAKALQAWEALSEAPEGSVSPPLYGTVTQLSGDVFRHVMVQSGAGGAAADLDVIALEGEIVKSLHF